MFVGKPSFIMLTSLGHLWYLCKKYVLWLSSLLWISNFGDIYIYIYIYLKSKLMHSMAAYLFFVSHICFIHYQLFQECSILLSKQETLVGRSIWLILCLLLVICSFAGISLKAAHKVSAKFVLHCIHIETSMNLVIHLSKCIIGEWSQWQEERNMTGMHFFLHR